jgi:pimeloyl-ACP methyl ester carboxylesterase
MKMKIDAAAMPAAVWHGILEDLACTDLTQNAALIAVPVLCIGGSSDPLFGLSHRRALSRAFKSVRSVTLEGHGHNPHWEDPKIVSKHLLSFLSEIRAT